LPLSDGRATTSFQEGPDLADVLKDMSDGPDGLGLGCAVPEGFDLDGDDHLTASITGTWGRTVTRKRTVGGIRLGSLSFCRPVAMEAICRTAVFPKSDTYGGEAEKRAVDGIRCELTLDFGRVINLT
jgi:hypothetical protein